MWKVVLGIGVLGACGALLRFGLHAATQPLQKSLGLSLPIGTLLVNLLGCFLFGLVWAWFESRVELSESYRLMILTGFMGAFTTYSTFAFETARLMETNAWFWAGTNVLLQTVGGIGAVFLGLATARMLFSTAAIN